MVPIDTPRKRIAFLLITLLVINLTAGSASAATKPTTTKSTASKATTTKKPTVKTTTTKKPTVKTTTTKTTTAKKSTSTKKSTTKKTVTKAKKSTKVATRVKASVIAADREMVLHNNDAPTSSLLTVTSTQTPSTSTMVVTNPVTSNTYSITVTTPATLLSYITPTDDVRGYYTQPIAGKLSQGIHDVNAVDFSAPVGTTVRAAAQGIVIAIANDDGYNGGYGNYIIISHPNGTETLYAHLAYATVNIGDVVSQAQPIAFSGRTGKVTGAHLHFEIRGAVNPWGSDSLGTTYNI